MLQIDGMRLKKHVYLVVVLWGITKKGSDVDIAVFGKGVTFEITNEIAVDLNERLPLPYYFDVLHFESLDNEELEEHIKKHGKPL